MEFHLSRHSFCLSGYGICVFRSGEGRKSSRGRQSPPISVVRGSATPARCRKSGFSSQESLDPFGRCIVKVKQNRHHLSGERAWSNLTPILCTRGCDCASLSRSTSGNPSRPLSHHPLTWWGEGWLTGRGKGEQRDRRGRPGKY